MLEQRIQQHFIDSADLKYQSAQVLGGAIAAAVQALMACVTSGCKVLVCGNGASVALAQHFAATFVGPFERERPELAALALSTDGAAGSAQGELEPRQVFARQVRALGLAGDVLLTLSADGQSPSVLAAIEAAHGRDMTVVALTGRGGGPVGAKLRETDVHVCVPHERLARVQEVHILVLHCICDGVDAQLLGEQEVPT
ncbi:MAG: SIS domain-containing protein [Curvibacter sp.]|nr:SIS domain-containing protein [Curvibacter sp.]